MRISRFHYATISGFNPQRHSPEYALPVTIALGA
jgi:hypothetical protein